MTKYNVLITAYCVDSNDVGEAKIAYEWINALADHVQLTVITTGARLNPQCGLENDSRINLIKLPPRFSFKAFDIFDRLVHPGYIEFYSRARKHIKRMLKSDDFDFGHHLAPSSIRFPAPFVGLKIRYMAGPFHGGVRTPSVMKELEIGEKTIYKLRSLDTIRMRLSYTLKKHYRSVSRLLVTAPYLEDVLSGFKIPKSQFSIIPMTSTHAVENGKRAKKDSLDFIFVGRLIPSKGLELIIEAFNRMESNQKIFLHIYGKGPYEAEFKEMAKNPDIVWHGFADNEVIHQALSEADAFLFPSLREPAGIALLEAMYHKLCCIAVDYGGPSYILQQDTGIKIPLGTRETMIKTLHKEILRVANDSDLRRTYGNNAYKRVTSVFTWENALDLMLKNYAEIGDPDE